MLFRNIGIKRKVIGLCAAAAAATLVCSIVFGILYGKYFETDKWLFALNTRGLTAFYAVLTVFCACIALFCLLALPKRGEPCAAERGKNGSVVDGSVALSEDVTDSDEADVESAAAGEESAVSTNNGENADSSMRSGNGEDAASTATDRAAPQPDPYIYEREPLPVKIIRLFVGAALIGLAVARSIALVNGRIGSSVPELLTVLSLILPIVFSVYFFPEFLEITTRKRSDTYAAFGIAGMLWLGLDAMTAYMDMTLPVASDHRILGILSVLLLMLFLSSDVRGRLSAPRPRLALALTCIASVFCGSVTVGRIVAYASGGVPLTDDLFRTLACAAMTLYVLSRLAFAACRAWKE